jgi:hypothetical protein
MEQFYFVVAVILTSFHPSTRSAFYKSSFQCGKTGLLEVIEVMGTQQAFEDFNIYMFWEWYVHQKTENLDSTGNLT